MHIVTCSPASSYTKDSWSADAKAMFLDLTGRSLDDVFDTLQRDDGNLITIIRRLGTDAQAQGTTFTLVRIPDVFSGTDKWEVAVDNNAEVVKINDTIVTDPMSDNDAEIGPGAAEWCQARGITYP